MLRYTDIKEAASLVLGFNPGDTRVIGYVNRACERLLEGLRAKGTVFTYRVCASNSCLALPRQIETVEAFSLGYSPGTVRGPWWEFVSPGHMGDCGCANEIVMGDEVASFDNVAGTGKKLAVYSDVTEDADAYVILQFWNPSSQWVRSQYPAASNTWIDGERLTLPAAGGYTYTTNECKPGGFVAAIKSRTRGTIRLYQYDINTTEIKPLAYWEPDEEVPRYRSLKVPGLSTANDGECGGCMVTIRGKARFIPVFNDNDFMQIQSREAIRLGCQAIAKEEKDLINDAANYWRMAFQVLDAQLAHYIGAGAEQPIQITNHGVYGGMVPNMI